MTSNRRGQVTAEMAVLFSFAIAGFIFMGFYLQRAAQGSTKSNTDSIGSQFSTTSDWEQASSSQTHERKTSAIVDTVKTNSCSKYSHGLGAGVADTVSSDADCVADGDMATVVGIDLAPN